MICLQQFLSHCISSIFWALSILFRNTNQENHQFFPGNVALWNNPLTLKNLWNCDRDINLKPTDPYLSHIDMQIRKTHIYLTYIHHWRFHFPTHQGSIFHHEQLDTFMELMGPFIGSDCRQWGIFFATEYASYFPGTRNSYWLIVVETNVAKRGVFGMLLRLFRNRLE